jgi:asparagine synthase (glutamine-hydrolysing)
MSGIAGIVNLRDGFAGRSVDLSLLDRMTQRLAHRGPDGISFWSSGPVGLANAAMHTTPESETEVQPHSDEQGRLFLTLDGRIDNREQLRNELETAGQRIREFSDAELVLRAYSLWGEGCAERLLGDFAFALWDALQRKLYCARDIIGLRPFYYSQTAKDFLFASEPRALLESSDVSREPNEAAVAAHLTCNFQDNEETLYRSILRLPPAHVLVVSAREARLRKYWAPDPAKRIRYASDADYAEHFLQILRSAVNDRMRVNGPVGALLSGGVDSSSITSLMLEQLRAAGKRPQDLETFSMIFPGEDCDESVYLRDIAQAWGHRSNLVPMEPVDSGLFFAQAARDLDFPGYPNGELVMGPLKRQALAKGIRVLLTGLGGDEWLTGDYLHYADYIKNGQLFQLYRQWKADRHVEPGDQRVATQTMSRFPILRYGIWPLLPVGMKKQIKNFLKPGPGKESKFLGDALLKQVEQLPRKDWSSQQGIRFKTLAQREIGRILVHPWHIHSLELFERASSQSGVEMRSPFEDRRVIEFSLALPEEQRWRGRQTKFVLREAMRGRILESVRNRMGKAEFSGSVFKSLLGLERSGILESMKIAEIGWANQQEVATVWDSLKEKYGKHDESYILDIWYVWMAVGVELWSRALRAEL